ncbi:hypothetical protein NDU88_002711 [Pleurodeles waltl]|uniref:Uncharacterized protein n=1 Tax=Pleurodeles waltl TaxID=8319 RepID=A0AAV7KSX0_PLEWA|nr:hypothetical protein NDU88_002711 [Pleurodeles waltl]
MAAGSSSATKESGALFRLPPSNEKVCPMERVFSVLFTAPLGAKWQPAALVPLRSLGLVVQATPKERESLSRGAGLQRPFHCTSGHKMKASGSSAGKESAACGSGSPQANKKFVLRSGFAASFTPHLRVQNGSRWL